LQELTRGSFGIKYALCWIAVRYSIFNVAMFWFDQMMAEASIDVPVDSVFQLAFVVVELETYRYLIFEPDK
jgi:hypothetical protein